MDVFANPAVTIACTLSDTFARIAPRDVPGFLMAGALAAAYFFRWLSEGTVMLSKAKKVDYRLLARNTFGRSEHGSYY